MPLFSVIVPTFNRRNLILETLGSVRAQTFRDFEVIVVDDGSDDDTHAMLREAACPLTVIRQSHQGPGMARNRGADEAKGRYLAFLDSDDLWLPWTLETVAQIIEAHGEPAIVSGQLRPFTDAASLKALRFNTPEVQSFSNYYASADRPYFVGAGMAAIRRDEFRKVGGFPPRPINLEDHDLILRLGEAPGFVQILEPVTVGWRRHASSSTANVEKSFAGARALIESELRGIYPGGRGRELDRRRIVSSHVRPIVFQLLDQGSWRNAWALYRATFSWHVRLGRLKFLAGFIARSLIKVRPSIAARQV